VQKYAARKQPLIDVECGGLTPLLIGAARRADETRQRRRILREKSYER
jgi:hypothetical protein